MDQQNIRILIIEDEIEIARFMVMELQCEGYQVHVENTGRLGLIKARELNPDLILLDWMLPEISGIEICKRLKKSSQTPIIMLTAKSETNDIVQGLESGANDYITKPFSLDELLARIRVQLRLNQKDNQAEFTFMDLTLNTQTRQVKRNGKSIDLQPKEFEVLMALIQNPKQVFSKEHLLQKVWDYSSHSDTNIIEVCIYKLRGKIEHPELPKLIHTIHGVGYSLRKPL